MNGTALPLAYTYSKNGAVQYMTLQSIGRQLGASQPAQSLNHIKATLGPAQSNGMPTTPLISNHERHFLSFQLLNIKALEN